MTVLTSDLTLSDLVKLREEVEQRVASSVEEEISALKAKFDLVVSELKVNPRELITVLCPPDPPKYRGANGKTWSGRGKTPAWLAEAISEGKTREDFLID